LSRKKNFNEKGQKKEKRVNSGSKLSSTKSDRDSFWDTSTMMMISIILYPLLIWKITLVISGELDSGLRIVPSSVMNEWNPSSQFQSSATKNRQLQEYPRPYALWNSEEIHAKLLEWKAMYPSLVHVTTAQESYGLPRSGGPNDCPFDKGGDGCLNYILTLQDFIAHPDGSASSSRLPEVLWSGCVHGTYDAALYIYEKTKIILSLVTMKDLNNDGNGQMIYLQTLM
jgi:hypothetical protein